MEVERDDLDEFVKQVCWFGRVENVSADTRCGCYVCLVG